MAEVATGFLRGDVPFVRIGQGAPLVMLNGLSFENEVPRGVGLRMVRASASRFSEHFTVHSLQPKRGLAPGDSMSDIAGHVADAIEHDIGEPVFLSGTSTGGSLALQLAVDRPGLIRRLVVVSAAHRLGPKGRAIQAEAAALIRNGDRQGGVAALTTSVLPEPMRAPLRPLSGLLMRGWVPEDLTDMLITLDAEDAFDVGGQLHFITAPTLVIGGGRDELYSPALFEATAAGVQDGRLHMFPNWGHVRVLSSRATSNIGLGFLLAGLD